MRPLSDARYYLYKRWQYGRLRWRYLLNKEPTMRHYRAPLPASSSFARKALEDLRRDGIATFHIHDLSGGRDLFDRICGEERARVEEHSGKIAAQRKVLESGRQEEFKDFLVIYLPTDGKLSYHRASTQLALHKELLGVINAYMGMYAELRGLEFWYTLAWPHQRATASQLWHRDFEDMDLIKVFLYLSDVDGESGPFSFVRGTHRGHLRWRDPQSVVPSGTIRADDERMAAMVPPRRWFVGTGQAGTMIMAATKGYHKGGFAITRDRRLVKMTYLSHSCKEDYLPHGIGGVPVDAHPAVRFAAREGS